MYLAHGQGGYNMELTSFEIQDRLDAIHNMIASGETENMTDEEFFQLNNTHKELLKLKHNI